MRDRSRNWSSIPTWTVFSGDGARIPRNRPPWMVDQIEEHVIEAFSVLRIRTPMVDDNVRHRHQTSLRQQLQQPLETRLGAIPGVQIVQLRGTCTGRVSVRKKSMGDSRDCDSRDIVMMQIRLPAVDTRVSQPSGKFTPFTHLPWNSHIAGYVTVTSTTRSRLWSDRREGAVQLARPFLSEI